MDFLLRLWVWVGIGTVEGKRIAEGGKEREWVRALLLLLLL